MIFLLLLYSVAEILRLLFHCITLQMQFTYILFSCIVLLVLLVISYSVTFCKKPCDPFLAPLLIQHVHQYHARYLFLYVNHTFLT